MSHRTGFLSIAIASFAILYAGPSRACLDKAAVEDINIQIQMPGTCWPEFFQAADKWYGFWLNSSWNGSPGRQDACNVTRPFTKMMSAIWVINYALTDNYSAQWHATEDYWPESRAMGTGYHGDVSNVFRDVGSAEANSDASPGGDTNYFCTVFDGLGQGIPGQSNSTVNRASVIVHEMWHHWQAQNGYKGTHPTACPLGACDPYYFHTVSAFDFGRLKQFSLNPLLFHSPYQLNVEFDCDVAEMSIPSMPRTTTQVARMYANARLRGQFTNAVGYVCGNPRPF